MIPSSYFLRMASACAAVCASVPPPADVGATASQWHKHLSSYAAPDLGRAFGTWQNRSRGAGVHQLPNPTEIKDLMGPGAVRRSGVPARNIPSPAFLEQVQSVRRAISAAYPPSSIDRPGHMNHSFVGGVVDNSACPVCGDADEGPGRVARDRREYIGVLLESLPTPTEPTYPCRCGLLEGWLELGDGVAPCPECHPAGVSL